MIIPKTSKINKCRLCGNKNLNLLYKFGNLFVSNFVSKNMIKEGIKAPLNLVHCNKCDLLQLSHSAPQEIMYKKFYWYRSSVTKLMRNALKDIFNSSKKFVKLNKDDYVLDIGANDGTLLRYYKDFNVKTIGCEPAKNLEKELKKNCDYLISDFWSKESFNKLKSKNNIIKKPKLILAIGMFYDLENPGKFISDASNCLDENGIFIAQLMCLSSMIETNDLGNICHEHLEFYSFKSLKYLFENNGFKIFRIEKNDINGGSYRIFCKKNIKRSISYKEKVTLKDVKNFISRVEKNKKETVNFIKKETAKGKKIFLYGASTKGNTLLQYYNLDKKLIPFAAERSPEKWGKYTIGSGVKIISEKEARLKKPDYFFVMPYAFIKEFKIREKEWLKKGGKFILPYPKFKIVK
ncbi:class I SAM-dependent methyltransferase [Pelagibacteraceae bacterium]|nr:class I SAM-dependent methyltransferase [Pelagibacteraceae bacterium]